MSLLYRNGTGRNNIAWGGSTSTAATYLRRTSTGRNDISYISISSNGTYNILNRTSTGRNNISWINTTFSLTQTEINCRNFISYLNNRSYVSSIGFTATGSSSSVYYKDLTFTDSGNGYFTKSNTFSNRLYGHHASSITIRCVSDNKSVVVNYLNSILNRVLFTKMNLDGTDSIYATNVYISQIIGDFNDYSIPVYFSCNGGNYISTKNLGQLFISHSGLIYFR